MRTILDILRAFFRIIGALCWLIGLLCFSLLVAVVLIGQGRPFQPLGRAWMQHDPFAPLLHTQSLPLVEAVMSRKFPPGVWDPVMLTILSWPAWVGLLALGFLFMVAGRVLFGLTGRAGHKRHRRRTRKAAA